MAAIPAYQKLREQILQRGRASEQEADEAVARRLASMGTLNSGEYLKQARLAREGVQGKTQEALSSLDVQEEQETQRRKEIEEQREFQRQERLGGQEFASKESELGRTLQKDLAKENMDFQKMVFDRQYQWRIFDEQMANREFAENKRINEQNLRIAAMAALDTDDPNDENLQILLQQMGVGSPSKRTIGRGRI